MVQNGECPAYQHTSSRRRRRRAAFISRQGAVDERRFAACPAYSPWSGQNAVDNPDEVPGQEIRQPEMIPAQPLAPNPPRIVQPEILPVQPAPNPPRITRPEILPVQPAPNPPRITRPEILPVQPEPNPPRITRPEILPVQPAPNPPHITRPEILPAQPALNPQRSLPIPEIVQEGTDRSENGECVAYNRPQHVVRRRRRSSSPYGGFDDRGFALCPAYVLWSGQNSVENPSTAVEQPNVVNERVPVIAPPASAPVQPAPNPRIAQPELLPVQPAPNPPRIAQPELLPVQPAPNPPRIAQPELLPVQPAQNPSRELSPPGPVSERTDRTESGECAAYVGPDVRARRRRRESGVPMNHRDSRDIAECAPYVRHAIQ